MITTVFRSADLPPEQRLVRFEEFQAGSRQPMRVAGTGAEEFRATERTLDLAALNVTELTCSSLELRRPAQLIRECDPQLYSIVIPLRGELAMSQAGRRTTLDVYDFALCDSSLPLHLRIAAGGHETAASLRVQVPHALLPLPADEVGRLLAVRLSGRRGVGALLTQFFRSLIADAHSYRLTDIPRMSAVAVDLLTATLVHHLDSDTRLPDDSRQRAHMFRIQAFVQQHLSDPGLSPQAIAAAHHISISYLHRLFQAHGTTVSALIRRQRLDRARHDLTDPRFRDLPVHRIAARWGFTNHTAFTRAFRAAFGVPPSQYRQYLCGAVGAEVS